MDDGTKPVEEKQNGILSYLEVASQKSEMSISKWRDLEFRDISVLIVLF